MSVLRWLSVCLLGVSLCLSAGSAAAKERYHTVYKGQRLGSIAKRYNVSVDALCAANGISRKDPIQPGQKLVIPEKGESVEEASKRAKQRAKKEDEQERAKADDAKADRKTPRKASRRKAPRRKASRRKEAHWRVHTIGKGQRLGSIAKRYHVSIHALAFANDITRTTVIQPGQKLVIPQRDDETGEAARKARDAGRVPGLEAPGASSGRSERAHRSARKSSRAKESWKDYRRRPSKRGYVTLIGYAGSWKGYVTTAKGGINPGARKAISRVLDAADLEGGIHPRLIKLLAQVSDTFGGRPIRVVSGHRTRSYAKASRHALGHAIDFSIPGVPNEVLRDYLLRYDLVGVGYYPNSSFVHFDVRNAKTYWVDHSGPGEPPRYSYIGKGPDPKTLD
ncbi:MAG: LysM peptidoglycan-binding domain-containing protein [Myxococcales bacterium]|nr:LysM peptidoglycan-binding domain-containing protein [Myxococcales bacterium]